MYSTTTSTKIIVERFYGLSIGGTGGDEIGTGTVALSETKGQTEDSFDEVDAGTSVKMHTFVRKLCYQF